MRRPLLIELRNSWRKGGLDFGGLEQCCTLKKIKDWAGKGDPGL